LLHIVQQDDHTIGTPPRQQVRAKASGTKANLSLLRALPVLKVFPGHVQCIGLTAQGISPALRLLTLFEMQHLNQPVAQSHASGAPDRASSS